MDYSPLFNSMTNNSVLRDATEKLHKMSDPNTKNPYTSTQADNCRTASEILEYQFMRHLGIENVDQKQNLLTALTKILQEEGYPQDKIDATLTTFNQDVTIAEFTSDYNNSHVLKSMAFPNSKAFRAAIKDLKQNRPRKYYEIELSPQYLLSLLKSNDSLARDKVRNNFFANLKLFVERVEALIKKPPSRPNPPSDSEQACKLLVAIQKNSLINAKNALAAKAKEQEKILTLKDYSARDQFGAIKYVPKALEKVAKTIQNRGEGQRGPIDLIENDLKIPCQLNCFKCSSSGVATTTTEASTHPSSSSSTSSSPSPPPYVDDALTSPKPLSFVDKAYERANVWRIYPLQTPYDVEQHELNFHTLHDPNKLTAANRHSKTFFCRFCTKNMIQWSLICCRYAVPFLNFVFILSWHLVFFFCF